MNRGRRYPLSSKSTFSDEKLKKFVAFSIEFLPQEEF